MKVPYFARDARRRLRVIAAIGLIAACDASGGVVPAGRYTYVASHPTPSGEDTIRLEGVLQVDEVGPDTVEGHWDVDQLHPELRLRVDESGGRTLIAHPTYFGTLEHRFRRIGSALACSGSYVWVVDGGDEESTPLMCSITPTTTAAPAAQDGDSAPS